MNEKNELVAVPNSRLQMPAVLSGEVKPNEWVALTTITYKDVVAPEKIMQAWILAKHYNLDLVRRHIEIVPYRSKDKNGHWKDDPAVIFSIHGLRALAKRAGYCGRDEFQLGPEKEFKFPNGNVIAPEWAQLTVYEFDAKNNRTNKFPGERIYFRDAVATYNTDSQKNCVNSTWLKRGTQMLQKCAEAAALRAAFPEDIGGTYIEEEISEPFIAKDITDQPTKPQNQATMELKEQINKKLAPSTQKVKNHEQEKPTPKEEINDQAII